MAEPTHALTHIEVHPERGRPGRALSECVVGPGGLDGNRRKKAAVHVVAAEESADVRANLVLDLTAAELAASVGRVLRVGEIALDVRSVAGTCPGVYADVRTPGTVRVGDAVSVTFGR